MDSRSSSANGSNPAGKDLDPPAAPQSGADDVPAVEITMDYRRLTPESEGPDSGVRPLTPEDVTFLEPPRGGDEIGWLAHYRVRKVIGTGGMGLVFLAEDSQLGRPVALKVIRPELADSPEASARFTREARAAAAIKHDHVVTIYQVGEAEGVAFLAMEFLQGISLQSWLDRGKTPSVDLILRIGREMANGLVAAHRLGLVHRDIKPANIWLESPNGRVKILDFGQARAECEDVQITQSGAIVGTPAYMSPEQAAGEPPGTSSDLFSLGCVLYRLCCGRLPFQGNTILSVLNALASHTPTSPIEVAPDLPEGLSTLVSSLLAKNPSERPASAQAVSETIRTLERQLAARRQTAGLKTNAIQATAPQPNSQIDTGERPVDDLSSWPEVVLAKPERRGIPITAWAGLLATLLVITTRFAINRRPGIDQSASIGPPPQPPPSPEVAEGTQQPKTQVAPPTVPGPPAPPSTARTPVIPAPVAADPGRISETPQNATKAAPPESAPAGPTSKVAESPTLTSKESWGLFVDPDGDCRLRLQDEPPGATIEVPGRPHLLSAEIRKMNAPHTLRPVKGDFLGQVHAGGTEQVAGRPTTQEYPAYQGAGILLWQDPGNYIRLEIATHILKGKPRHYTNFEYRQDSQLVFTKGPAFTSGSAHLRLERRGKTITASVSTDGVQWDTFPALKVTLAENLEIGLVSINTATKPLVARFEDFRVTSVPSPSETPLP